MFANGAAAALDAFYCCHVVLTINGGSFCGTLFRPLTAAGCEKHFPRREYSVGMHGVAIHATHCQHRIGNQFTEAVRGIRDIVGRVATIAGGCAARHFGIFLQKKKTLPPFPFPPPSPPSPAACCWFPHRSQQAAAAVEFKDGGKWRCFYL